ncbi:hypothetical protein P279_21125 [Rhodobacteraceae bacterium PD-2]|nr:hypothetical protein [Ponticoccus alexandrii]ETA50161.1 hypothetical protein P279_21125 [Rhodobacteraceae bacterium PD-2]
MADLRALEEKSVDADLLREMIGCAAERLMEPEVGATTGAHEIVGDGAVEGRQSIPGKAIAGRGNSLRSAGISESWKKGLRRSFSAAPRGAAI